MAVSQWNCSTVRHLQQLSAPSLQSRWPIRAACIALGLVSLLLLLHVQIAQAHGGVIIDSGVTDEHEWLVVVSAYPPTRDETIVTLLVYERVGYEPVTDLSAELTLTSPGQEDVGPFELTTDPVEYPGDYSETISLPAAGEWQARFRAWSENIEISVTTSLDVAADNPSTGQNLDTLSPDVEGIASTSLSTRAARSQPSQLAGGQIFRDRWGWLWTILALVPLALVVAWGLRPLDEE